MAGKKAGIERSYDWDLGPVMLTDLRYATPSPAVWPACERKRPFFLKTKLEPMRRPLVIARTMPTI